MHEGDPEDSNTGGKLAACIWIYTKAVIRNGQSDSCSRVSVYVQSARVCHNVKAQHCAHP